MTSRLKLQHKLSKVYLRNVLGVFVERENLLGFIPPQSTRRRPRFLWDHLEPNFQGDFPTGHFAAFRYIHDDKAGVYRTERIWEVKTSTDAEKVWKALGRWTRKELTEERGIRRGSRVFPWFSLRAFYLRGGYAGIAPTEA